MIIALCYLALLCFLYRRLLRHLRFLQQDDYQPERYLRWFWAEKAFDKRGSGALLTGLAASYLFPEGGWLATAVLLTLAAFLEPDPRQSGKLRLNMTARAKRIFRLAWLMAAVAAASLAYGQASPIYALVLIQAVPLLLFVAVKLLSGNERKLQQRYLAEATAQLGTCAPFVIGITGSYGKTSTKDALANILQVACGPTFWPEKGINTLMGVTRSIRNHLRKGHRLAVIEMAAYGEGSIAKLCRLTPPQAAIITTIGLAHLDRFGSWETIRSAKSELAQAVPQEGILVCNGDDQGARWIADKYRKKTTLLYGYDQSGNDLDCWISMAQTTVDGTEYAFCWRGKEYTGKTALMGRTAIANLAGAFAMACALGAQPELVIAAINNLKPVENRLQVKRDKEVTYIHDAYNSNPQGFATALDILGEIPAGKRYLMTPGMIELAEKQTEEHVRLGRKAAQICDTVIVVGSHNRKSLIEGLRQGGLDLERILVVDDREQAFRELRARIQAGDAVLIENDLPDLFEAKELF